MQFANLPTLALSAVILLPTFSLAFSRLQIRWKIAQFATAIAVLLSCISWVFILSGRTIPLAKAWINQGLLNVTMLVLISFIAFIVLSYAKTNFEENVDNQRFLRWFLLTVVAVMVTVSSNNLIVFWLAWVAISLSMHQLLTFYPNRYRATLAAHKKFIFARLAELCLAAAFGLMYAQHKTLLISSILDAYPATLLSWQQQLAAAFLAVAALIKCAQLPIHGWLIQVVESPTPVSALLHAGVINMGGFLLLSFAPLFSQAQVAQWIVLIIAGITTVIAALVMMTRISIKVRLAWSTTAQMGLMLVECALALYELAFLHLLAHSCYKAYAFLNSGHAVDDALQRQFVGSSKPSLMTWLISLMVTILLLCTLNFAVGLTLPMSPWLLISFAIVFTLSTRLHQAPCLSVVTSVLHGALLLTSYYVLKTGVGFLITSGHHNYNFLEDLWISLLFFAMFVLHFFLQYRPHQLYSRRLFIALHSGFYIDEWATRLTLKLWSIKIPKNYMQTRLTILDAKL